MVDGTTPPGSGVGEINAVTLFTADMGAAVRFYETLGLPVLYGGPGSSFTSLALGPGNYLNLSDERTPPVEPWGRWIIHVDSPDDRWQALVEGGYQPAFEPRDAPWGERYFHVLDPDGHELSVARRLDVGD